MARRGTSILRHGKAALAVVAVAAALGVGGSFACAGTQAGAVQAAVASVPSGQVPFTDAVLQEDAQFG